MVGISKVRPVRFFHAWEHDVDQGTHVAGRSRDGVGNGWDQPWGMRALVLAAALASAVLAGCGAAAPAQMAPPEGPGPSGVAGEAAPGQTAPTGDGTWVLESLDGQPLIEHSFIVLTVSVDLATGFDGCNRYGGRSADGGPVFNASGKFSAPPICGTQIGCLEPEGILDQADAYLRALMQGRTFSIAGERLEILDSGGAARLVFVRQGPLAGDPFDLTGTGWSVVGQSDARAATMYFLDDRLVTGVTACRAYLAIYHGTGGNVRFPSTSMLTYTHSCPEDASRMEGDFTDFLTWAREYAVSEDGDSRILRMRSSRGRTLTLEPLSPTVGDVADAGWTLVAFVELRDDGSGFQYPLRVVQETEVTMSFDEDGISGSSGCNSYLGQATAENGVITIDVESFSHTEKYCEEPERLMDQEQRFLDLLPRVNRYGTYGDGLYLETDDGVFLLFSAR